MAEFCVECWNDLHGTRYREEDYVLTKYPELCEGCGEFKRVIVRRRKEYISRNVGWLIIPICIIRLAVMLIWRLILFLIRKIKQIKSNGDRE